MIGYLALERNELTHATTWNNFEKIMLNEIRQAQEGK